MASGAHDDDDALRWEGDDGAPATDAGLPRGWHAVGRGSGDAADAAIAPTPPDAAAERPGSTVQSSPETSAAGDPSALGNVALVGLGLLGGIYLLYTVGWILGGSRLRDAGVFLVPASAVVPAVWVGFAAPALWFGATLVLTRGSAVWLRLTWLVAGAFLLVPWPFVMGV